jgi:hypothetical protein
LCLFIRVCTCMHYFREVVFTILNEMVQGPCAHLHIYFLSHCVRIVMRTTSRTRTRKPSKSIMPPPL